MHFVAEQVKEQVAKELLKIKAVFLRPDEPFIWASGIKSPVYCDNRLTLSFPESRKIIEQALANLIQDKYPQADALMGTSTAGIPHAAIAAHLMGIPMGYVRSGAKDHGRKNRVEGRLEKGWKVVVVEDLISTGGSVLEIVEALQEEGAEVLSIVSIYTYNMEKSVTRFKEAGVENTSLTDFDTVVRIAAQEGYISESDIQRLISFRNNPSDESWIGAKE